MTPEQFAAMSPDDQRALLASVRMRGAAAPEDPNLDAAATPLEPDPPVAALPGPRQSTPYEEEQRVRRLARRAGVSIDEAEQMVAADAAAAPGDPFAAYKTLRRVAHQRANDSAVDRRSEVIKRAQLRQNPLAYIARDDITDEQRRLVMESLPVNPYQARIRMGAGENDARLAVAQVQAQAQRDAAAAEAEARSADQRFALEFKAAADERAEAARLAAEERARVAVAQAAEEQRAFDREQNDLNRQVTFTQGDMRTQAELARMQADLDARRLEQAERMEQFKAQQEEAARRHEQMLMQMQADRESNTARWSAQDAATAAARSQEQQKIDAALEAQKRREELVAREAILEPMRAIHPGVDNLASGDYDSPVAQEALAALARKSDKSWMGFNAEDALRMDAILFRLGVNDPAVRHSLVARHGLAPNIGITSQGGGRGSFLSGLGQFFYGAPSYPVREKGADGTVPTL